MNNVELLLRVMAGEPAQDVIENLLASDQREFRAWLARECPAQLAGYDKAMKLLDLGITGARNCWHSITHAQRCALIHASVSNGRLERVGKEYRHAARHQPYIPIHVAAIRPLCARELLAWDGGAFDPEQAAVLTERGRFVVTHGSDPLAADPCGKAPSQRGG